eukprot:m.1120021 g.1120021  ORF g.1120021 m.1120021 type:complete len:981 (-) comp24394_c1_seq4:625-3567(-)
MATVVNEWTPDHVIHWLKVNSLDDFHESFLRMQLSGEQVLALNSAAIKVLGKFPDKRRKALLKAVSQLKKDNKRMQKVRASSLSLVNNTVRNSKKINVHCSVSGDSKIDEIEDIPSGARTADVGGIGGHTNTDDSPPPVYHSISHTNDAIKREISDATTIVLRGVSAEDSADYEEADIDDCDDDETARRKEIIRGVEPPQPPPCHAKPPLAAQAQSKTKTDEPSDETATSSSPSIAATIPPSTAATESTGENGTPAHSDGVLDVTDDLYDIPEHRSSAGDSPQRDSVDIPCPAVPPTPDYDEAPETTEETYEIPESMEDRQHALHHARSRRDDAVSEHMMKALARATSTHNVPAGGTEHGTTEGADVGGTETETYAVPEGLDSNPDTHPEVVDAKRLQADLREQQRQLHAEESLYARQKDMAQKLRSALAGMPPSRTKPSTDTAEGRNELLEDDDSDWESLESDSWEDDDSEDGADAAGTARKRPASKNRQRSVGRLRADATRAWVTETQHQLSKSRGRSNKGKVPDISAAEIASLPPPIASLLAPSPKSQRRGFAAKGPHGGKRRPRPKVLPKPTRGEGGAESKGISSPSPPPVPPKPKTTTTDVPARVENARRRRRTPPLPRPNAEIRAGSLAQTAAKPRRSMPSIPPPGDRRHGGSGARRMPTPPKATSSTATTYISAAERDRRRRLRDREMARQRREAKKARETNGDTQLLPASMMRADTGEAPYDIRTTPEYKGAMDGHPYPAPTEDVRVSSTQSGHDYRVATPVAGETRPHDYRSPTGEIASEGEDLASSCYQAARMPVSKNSAGLPAEDAAGKSDYAVALEAPPPAEIGDGVGPVQRAPDTSSPPPPVVPRRGARTCTEPTQVVHTATQGAPTWMNMPYYRGFMSRREAESVLYSDGRNGSFLVRSSRNAEHPVLSFLYQDNVRHTRIRCGASKKFFLGDDSMDDHTYYDTIEQLVASHQRGGGVLQYICGSQ